jgi:hypothetical protein
MGDELCGSDSFGMRHYNLVQVWPELPVEHKTWMKNDNLAFDLTTVYLHPFRFFPLPRCNVLHSDIAKSPRWIVARLQQRSLTPRYLPQPHPPPAFGQVGAGAGEGLGEDGLPEALGVLSWASCRKRRASRTRPISSSIRATMRRCSARGGRGMKYCSRNSWGTLCCPYATTEGFLCILSKPFFV